MNHPLITIVTVVFNDAEHIESTILSVLSQSYRNIEYIVVDGNSCDGTKDIIEKFKDGISLYISEVDKGVYDAMNKGALYASGEWIMYLNSGDRLSTAETIKKIFEGNSLYLANIDVLYSDVIALHGDKSFYVKSNCLNKFWRGLPFSHQSNFVRVFLAKKYPFNLCYKICADYDFLYSLYKNNCKFMYCLDVIAKIDATKGISKDSSINLIFSEYIKISYKHSNGLEVIKLIIYAFSSYFYAVLKRMIGFVWNIH
jgi:glycosyltransferase involved in cell wall biosynthesis